jgi:hypothetical protein
MGLNLANTQQKIDSLIYNISERDRVLNDMYFSDKPKDVSFKKYDENGELKTVTMPNITKIIEQMKDINIKAEGGLIQRVVHNYTGGDWNPDNNWNWVPGLHYDFTPKKKDSIIKVYWNFATGWENTGHAISNWKGFANGVELFRNCLSASHWESRNTFQWQIESWGTNKDRIGLQCRSHSVNENTVRIHRTNYWEGGHNHQNAYSQMVIEEVR